PQNAGSAKQVNDQIRIVSHATQQPRSIERTDGLLVAAALPLAMPVGVTILDWSALRPPTLADAHRRLTESRRARTSGADRSNVILTAADSSEGTIDALAKASGPCRGWHRSDCDKTDQPGGSHQTSNMKIHPEPQ